MPAPDTEQTLFATTRWTLVCEAVMGGGTGAHTALGTLFGIYWQPLYRYARRKGKSKEDSEDLVQSFFAHLHEAEALRTIDHRRGRFRAFLLASFNYFMINQWRHDTRQKRGGTAAMLSFDWEDAETGLRIEPVDEATPDRLFDKEWAFALLGKVVMDLQRAYMAEGMLAQFEALKPCLTADSSRLPYAKLAADLGLSEGAARVAVHRLRKRYRALLVQEITRTLASTEMVEEEMRTLFSVLGA